jgi:AcrR family transcriptional regulator
MSESRKTSGAREKDLRLAMFRIQQGRAHTKATSLTIASVAREAGVSAALIHNHYPTIADAIRNAQGRDNRAQRVAKNLELLEERKKLRELRGENASLRDEVAKLASINEVLMNENETLRVALNNPKVVDFGSKKRKNSYRP